MLPHPHGRANISNSSNNMAFNFDHTNLGTSINKNEWKKDINLKERKGHQQPSSNSIDTVSCRLTMKNSVMISGSSSSIVITHRYNPSILAKSTCKQPPYLSMFTTVSCFSKSSCPPCPSSSSTSRPPFLLTSIYLSNNDPKESLSSYADIASRLVEDGRFSDFGLIVQSILSAEEFGSSEFGELLNLKLISAGIVKCLSEGRVRSVVELVASVAKLGVDVLGLFDESAMKLLKRKLTTIVNNGNVEEAVSLLETLAGSQFPARHLMKQSDMIKNCVDKRNPSMAVRYACLLPQRPVLFCSIIKEFGKKGDLVSALAVFEASKKFDRQNMYVYRSIIDVCGICGDWFRSRSIYEDILDQKVTPNIYVMNSLMNVNAHDFSYTMNVYKQMQNLGVKSDMTTYNILLKACCLAERVDLAQNIYEEVQDMELVGALKLDVFTYSTIIKVFTDAKMWQMAVRIKEDMLSAGVTPNTVTWSSLISSCAHAGLVDQAVRLFEEMLLAGCEPNTQCFNTLLHACVEACQYDRAFRLFQAWKGGGSQEIIPGNCEGSKDTTASANHISREVTKTNADYANVLHHLQFSKSLPFRPTTTTYNILMKACGSDVYRAKALMNEMKTIGLFPNHISWSTMINICGAAGNLAGALQIFKSMLESGTKPDVVAYTTAIKVCVESKNLNIAYSLFEEMKSYHIQPNLVTYTTLLRARTRYGTVQEVQQCLAVYQDMRKAGYKPNDYYLKQLIEEWCEGVIQGNNKKSGLVDTSDRCCRGPESLLLEKVAVHLQRNTTESLAIDIQGLSQVEARIVVLAVLRRIKENYASGYPIKDDLIIVLGVRKCGAEFTVQDAICRLLKNELGLEVVFVKPRAVSHKVSDADSNRIFGRDELPTKWDADTTRRPAVLERLRVSRMSLYHWLQKRSGAVNQ